MKDKEGKAPRGGMPSDISVIVSQWHPTSLDRKFLREYDDPNEQFAEDSYIYSKEDVMEEGGKMWMD